MASDATIHIQFKTDTLPAQKGMDDAAKHVESFGSKFKSTFAGVLAANVIQNLASKVFDFGKQSVEAYEKSQITQEKFLDSMSRIPGASADTTKALLDQAAALSQTTIYGKGASKQALTTLASFGLNGDQLKQLLPLVQDYAAKTGQDLPDAASAIGKALLGQGRALKGVGIDFKNTKTLTGNFAEITTGLTDKVGGLAEKMGGTDAGKMQIFQNRITGLKVSLGAALVPAIEETMKVLGPLLDYISKNTKWLVPLAAGIIAVSVAFKILNGVMALFGANPATLTIFLIAVGIVALIAAVILLWKNWDTVWSAIKGVIQAVWDFMQTAWDAILGIISGVWQWVSDNWVLLLGILTGPIGLAVALIITYWDQIKAGGQAVWDWINNTWNSLLAILVWPFDQAWIAIQAVWNGALTFFGNIPGWITSALSTVATVVSAPFKAAWTAVQSGLITPLKSAFDSVTSAISSALSGVENAITAPFKAAWDFINNNILSPLKSGWNTIANAVNSISFKVEIPSWVPVVGGKGFEWAPPHVPTLAAGGLVTRTGLILAHAGEAITPLPARARGDGPLVRIEHAHFSEKIDVEVFGKRLAWTVETAGV
jgi:phage-related protein